MPQAAPRFRGFAIEPFGLAPSGLQSHFAGAANAAG